MLVRLDNIDHTLAQPGPLDNSTLPKVPVIRIFGLSSLGQRACLHVHQVYPYFFVDYHGSLSPERVNRYIAKFTHSLNHAIALSLRRNPFSENARYIRAVLLVKGIPFYGFHTSYQPFLKVLIADPTFVSRAVTILQSGSILRTRFTTYENHLSYYLQFMSDFALYGCGWVELAEFFQRRPEANVDMENEIGVHAPPSPYFKHCRVPLEFDVCAHQIKNRHVLKSRDLHTRLQIPAIPTPAEPLVHSVRELWEDERRRRIARGLLPSPEMPNILNDRRRGAGPIWVDNARLEGMVTARCAAEHVQYKARNTAWEAWVMSTFESVEALWEPEWRTWRSAGDADGAEKANPFAAGSWDAPPELEIDETMLSSQEMIKLVNDEELAGNALDDDEDEGEDEGEPEEDHNVKDGAQSSLQDINHDAMLPDLVAEKPTVDQVHASASNSSQENSSLFQRHDVASQRTSSLAEVPGLAPALMEFPTGSPQNLTDSHDPKPSVALKMGSFLSSGSSFSHKNDEEESQAKRRGPDDLRNSLSLSATSNDDYAHSARSTLSTRAFKYAHPPPTTAVLLTSIPVHGMLYREYRDPYYSVTEDVPARPQEYAGLLFDLTRGPGTVGLAPYDENDIHTTGDSKEELTIGKSASKLVLEATGVSGWEYAGSPSPPSWRRTHAWLKEEDKAVEITRREYGPLLEGTTQQNVYGFKDTPPQPMADTRHIKQDMTILALEVFANSTGRKLPHPAEDDIVAVFYSFQDEYANRKTGIIAVDSPHLDARTAPHANEVIMMESELDLINRFIDYVLELDPDILAGWEVQAASWGYLEARGRTFGLDIAEAVGRAPIRPMNGGADQWGMRHTSTFKVVGRHVLNVWRLMRVELPLNMYSFENVTFHLLQQRTPKYTAATLSRWFSSPVPSQTARVLQYFLKRTSIVLKMLDVSEVVTKTVEFARVFGVDFFSVISRGSQFKVESFMFRIAKPESFVLISPSKATVGKQNAAECMPLIMEPYSAFYKGPVVVLDFQSLYPSVMIAYNYCYSTCLGRVQNFKGQNKFGVTVLENPPGLLSAVKEYLTISPNGMIFVKPEVRRGLLGKMLTELLDTRVMVKQAMKSARGDKALLRVLEARQLSLKFIANVTYGYTSATFSGRMPAVEIADAIVQSGRETLEKTIDIIESTKKWDARVVYGDTDSVFIYLQGRTKEQAFVIGNEIADTITASNPAPIKLKFEKVYLPSVLIAKKRYVGFKYERPDDQEPIFDAKGIETVRRDGIPAQQKMVERCLKILFRSQDLSEIKKYCQTSWKRILEGSISPQEFIFAKEVRLGTYSDKFPPPPGATVAARRMLQDVNDEPQYGERVPYIITRGEPGRKLVDRAVTPEEFLHDSNKHIDAEYYITRVLIPPLERVFNLMGVNVRSWYSLMNKSSNTDNLGTIPASSDPEDEENREIAAIDSHYRSNRCTLCGTSTDEAVCGRCRGSPEESLYALLGKIQDAEHRVSLAHSVCVSCTSNPPIEDIKCESLDCPWRFARYQVAEELDNLRGVLGLVDEIEKLAEKRKTRR